MGPAYQTRIIALDAEELRKIEVEPIYGELVVTKVQPHISNLVHPGDSILEINGEPLEHKSSLLAQTGCVKLKLVLSTIYTAPMEFCKVLESFSSNNNQHVDPYLSISLRKGDVLQVNRFQSIVPTQQPNNELICSDNNINEQVIMDGLKTLVTQRRMQHFLV